MTITKPTAIASDITRLKRITVYLVSYLHEHNDKIFYVFLREFLKPKMFGIIRDYCMAFGANKNKKLNFLRILSNEGESCSY